MKYAPPIVVALITLVLPPCGRLLAAEPACRSGSGWPAVVREVRRQLAKGGGEDPVPVGRAWLDAALAELAASPAWRPVVSGVRRQLAAYEGDEPVWVSRPWLAAILDELECH